MQNSGNSQQNGETILGVDYGETNIGLAFGRNGFSSPLVVISGKNTFRALDEIMRIVIDDKVDKVVIGLPLDIDGKETQRSIKVRRFANLLKTKTKKKVEYQNEYGTTIESLKGAIESGYSMKGRKKIDHLSAAIILKNYYERLNA